MKIEQLQKSPLFQCIQPEDLEGMLKCLNARETSFDKNEFIMSSDDTLHLIGVVLDGSVEMINEDSFGKKSILTVIDTGGVLEKPMPARRKSTAQLRSRRTRAVRFYCWIISVCCIPVRSPVSFITA